jgi:hypothetical protein
MVERDARKERLWSFPVGAVDTDNSVKGFEVETRDGPAGHVSWASYAPGESYLVVTVSHHLHRTHDVVPASAVEKVDTDGRKVWLHVGKADVERAPELSEPSRPVDSPTMAIARPVSAAPAARPRVGTGSSGAPAQGRGAECKRENDAAADDRDIERKPGVELVGGRSRERVVRVRQRQHPRDRP